jgi:hypothetical protein
MTSMLPFVVREEVWSISSESGERKLLASLGVHFVIDRQAAYEHAERLASEFRHHDLQEDAAYPYWWGRNEGERANHRFVIRPA